MEFPDATLASLSDTEALFLHSRKRAQKNIVRIDAKLLLYRYLEIGSSWKS
jgi:hypothetical protein